MLSLKLLSSLISWLNEMKRVYLARPPFCPPVHIPFFLRKGHLGSPSGLVTCACTIVAREVCPMNVCAMAAANSASGNGAPLAQPHADMLSLVSNMSPPPQSSSPPPRVSWLVSGCATEGEGITGLGRGGYRAADWVRAPRLCLGNVTPLTSPNRNRRPGHSSLRRSLPSCLLLVA